jgi:hypothetical protein
VYGLGADCRWLVSSWWNYTCGLTEKLVYLVNYPIEICTEMNESLAALSPKILMVDCYLGIMQLFLCAMDG